MNPIRTEGATLFGITGYVVTVDVELQDGLPGFDVSGTSPTRIREMRHRIRSALRASGIDMPTQRVAANFAPADLPNGPSLDLALAVGLLITMGVVPESHTRGAVFYGELGLDGYIRSCTGTANAALAASKAGRSRFYTAPETLGEASSVSGIVSYGPRTLTELIAHLKGELPLNFGTQPTPPPKADRAVDLGLIQGQYQGRRALEIAAAGRHNMLLVGSPGCGKTLLARALPGILPELTAEESLEVMQIHSAAGLTARYAERGLRRPFRAPHPTASEAALVGGGNPPMPGEVSLAHRGVLFLDEAAEFRKSSLDALSGPVKGKAITISRNRRDAKFPADMMLVLAMNPCPCGYHGDSRRECRCTPAIIRAYQARIQGSLLDQIDLFIDMPSVSLSEMAGPKGESSDVVQARVIKAHAIQMERQAGHNSELSIDKLEEVAPLKPDNARFLARAGNALNIRTGAWHRVIRVARTIADLEGAKDINQAHLAEAMSYRNAWRAIGG